jgi:CRISPR type III-B/RAMP module-associated protein Cmr5
LAETLRLEKELLKPLKINYKMALQRVNIEQKRASTAFEFAKNAATLKNYSSYAKKMPMYILNNGLLNALAFAYSKNDWKPLYEDIEKWLNEEPQGLIKEKLKKQKENLPEKEKDKALIKTILALEDSELRQRSISFIFVVAPFCKRRLNSLKDGQKKSKSYP